MTKCPVCKSYWVFLPGDVYCPLCGARIPFAEISLPEHPVLYSDYPDTYEFKVRIKNVHTAPITIRKLSSDPPCFGPKSPLGQEVQPDKSIEITLTYSRAPLKTIKKFPSAVSVTVDSLAGGNLHQDSAAIDVHPAPLAKAEEEGPIIVPGGNETGWIEKSIRVNANSTASTYVEALEQESGHAWFSLQEEVPAHISKGHLNIPVRLNPAMIEAGKYAAGALSLKIADHPALTIGFTVLRAPLEFADTNGRTVWTEHDTWLGLGFKNVSDTQITIASAEIDHVEFEGEVLPISPDRIALEHELVKEPLLVQARLERLKGHDFRLRVNGAELDPGDYDVTTVFRLNGQTSNELFERFRISVKEPDDCNEVLAIDFGTSNSCAVFSNPVTGVPDVLVLAPSSIALRGSDETVIGSAATEFGGQWVSAVKLEMGKEKPVLSGHLPRDLSSRFIRELLWRAEAKSKKRLRRLVLTHPSRFTNRQLNDFRYVLMNLKKGGYIDQCFLIDEASAAAFSIVASIKNADDMKEFADRGSFTLFVFDFGGGTIDMTFCELKSLEDGRREMRPINMGGLRRFGGTDIDRIILEIIAESFKSQLVQEKGIARSLVWVPISGKDLDENPYGLDDKTLEDLAGKITAWMSDIESTKIDLFRDRNTQSRQIPLRAYWGKNQHEDSNQQVDIHYEDLEEKVRERLLPAIKIMKQIIDESKTDRPDIGEPDLIVLAGGSSNIPLVEELIKQSFKSCVRKADRLKECVAVGACKYGQMEIAPGLSDVVIEDFGKRARSSFGYVASSDGEMVFRPVVRKGEPLPVEERQIDELRGTIQEGTVFKMKENFGSGTKLAEIHDDVEDIDEFVITREAVGIVNPVLFGESEVTLTVGVDESVELKLRFGDRSIPFRARQMTSYHVDCKKFGK